MSELQRDRILDLCWDQGLRVCCSKAFKLQPKTGESIDFFPPKANWHDNVPLQPPGSVKLDSGAQNAVKQLKKKQQDTIRLLGVRGFTLEQLVFKVQRETGLSNKNDPSGLKRYEEARARLSASQHGAFCTIFS